MTKPIIPTERVRGLEALELAEALGLSVWLRWPGSVDEPMTARQAWARIRDTYSEVYAGDFYTFEPANDSVEVQS